MYYPSLYFRIAGKTWRDSRHHNTRRHKPSICDFNDRELMTRSELFANSYDDSGFGTGEYCRTKIPSTLEPYDCYCVNKRLPLTIVPDDSFAACDDEDEHHHSHPRQPLLSSGSDRESRFPCLRETHTNKSTPSSCSDSHGNN